MGLYRDVFAVRAFRFLWCADLASIAGDRIARVGVSVLVYERTGSPLLAAAVYALTFLPAIVGPLLAGIGDRHDRRTVMVGADGIRAVLTLIMAIPGVPLFVLAILLTVVTALAAPHGAARTTMLRVDILPGDPPTLFVSGEAIRGTTSQISQLVGYSTGGLIAGINPYVALAANSLSFVISAGLILWGVPRARTGDAPPPHVSYWKAMVANGRTLLTTPKLRTLAWLAWLTTLSAVPEALAVPYADAIGGGPVAAGLLIAADPAGMAAGIFILRRLLPRPVIFSWMAPLAALSGVPLLLTLLEPPVPISALLFAVCGACSGYLFVGAGPEFQDQAPEGAKAGLMGWFRSGTFIMQGVATFAAGVLADAIGPAGAMAVIGAVAIIAGVHAAGMWHRANRPQIEPSTP